MPLFASVAIIAKEGWAYSHLFVTVAADEATAIEAAKADLGQHPDHQHIIGASISEIDPEAVRLAYAELPPVEQVTH